MPLGTYVFLMTGLQLDAGARMALDVALGTAGAMGDERCGTEYLLFGAVATASGAEPVIAGKPHRPMAELVAATCGPSFSAATAIMVGDRWSTDGAFAEVIGCPFALVRSGVTPPAAAAGGVAQIDAADLSAVADVMLGS